MRITVVGGSKGTGARFAALAHAAGHEVTVVSRSGAGGAAGLRHVAGDASEPVVATEAVAGADAVVITVGAAKGVPNQRTAVTRSIVDAMRTAGVGRLLVQSSLGAGDSVTQLPGLLGVLTKLVLTKPLADHNSQEDVVRASGLDWTILRPTGLTDKDPTGGWRMLQVSDDGRLGGTITRGDLAALMLETLDDARAIGKSFGISN